MTTPSKSFTITAISEQAPTQSFRGASNSPRVPIAETITIDARVLKEKMSDFITNLLEVTNDLPVPQNGYKLSEFEITAEITAQGEFKICGTGIGLEGKGGLIFRFKREE